MLAEKQIPGILTDRVGNSCTYVPNIYTKSLNNWVMNFYSNNNYLGIKAVFIIFLTLLDIITCEILTDYEAMNNVGITDPISFISRMQFNKELIALSTCSIGPKILNDILAAVEESIISGTWIDVMVCFNFFYFF